MLMMLAGCTALTTTTDHGIAATKTLGRGLASSTRASYDKLVTEPDTPRYASARVFVASTLPMLRREAAAGSGENIATLAQILDIDSDTLGYWMQAHYATLFETEPSPDTIVQTIVASRS